MSVMRYSVLVLVTEILALSTGCGSKIDITKVVQPVLVQLNGLAANELVHEASLCIREASSLSASESSYYPKQGATPVALKLGGLVWIDRVGPNSPCMVIQASVPTGWQNTYRVYVLVKPGGGISTNTLTAEFHNCRITTYSKEIVLVALDAERRSK